MEHLTLQATCTSFLCSSESDHQHNSILKRVPLLRASVLSVSSTHIPSLHLSQRCGDTVDQDCSGDPDDILLTEGSYVAGGSCHQCPGATPYSPPGSTSASACVACPGNPVCDGTYGAPYSACPSQAWDAWNDVSGAEGQSSCLRLFPSGAASWTDAGNACVASATGAHLLTVKQPLTLTADPDGLLATAAWKSRSVYFSWLGASRPSGPVASSGQATGRA